MRDVNPYQSPETQSPRPVSHSGARRSGRLRCALQGAAAGVLGSFPLAAVVAGVFRFPIPFAGYASGPGAMLPAMFAALMYGLLGGLVVQAIAGGVGGIAAYGLARDRAQLNLLSILFGAACALPGLLVLATLDWMIGPW
jgi:hypothetical protein